MQETGGGDNWDLHRLNAARKAAYAMFQAKHDNIKRAVQSQGDRIKGMGADKLTLDVARYVESGIADLEKRVEELYVTFREYLELVFDMDQLSDSTEQGMGVISALSSSISALRDSAMHWVCRL